MREASGDWRGYRLEASAASAAEATTAAAIATASAAATETAAIATASAAATETTTAVFTGLHWTCFVDGQGTACAVSSVHFCNRILCFCVGRHFDKTEALAAAGFAIGDHFCGFNRADASESVEKELVINGKRKVSDVQFLAQISLLETLGYIMPPKRILSPMPGNSIATALLTSLR